LECFSFSQLKFENYSNFSSKVARFESQTNINLAKYISIALHSQLQTNKLKMTSKKTTITTRCMNSPQASGPHMKRQIAGIFDSDAREFFLGDHSHLHRKLSIIPGTFDPISEIFYPESPTLDPVVKVKYNMRKYPALNPLSPPKGSSTKKNSQPTQQYFSLVSTL